MSLIKVFNFTTCLMVMAGALSLAVAEESLTYTTIILVGVITSYFWVEEKKVFYLSERLKTPLTIIYLLFAFLDMSLFSRSFVMTLAHLLLLIQLTKLLGKKSDGDYFQIYLISLALLIVAAVITVELYFFFFFIGVVIFGSVALALFQIKRQAPSENLPPGTFLGATICPAISVLIFTTFLFFLVPRIGFGFLQRNFKGPSLTSGFSEEVELGAIGSIKEGYEVVMRIKPGKTAKRLPEAQLWRGIALTDYAGGKWRVDSNKIKRVRANKKGVITLKEVDGQNLYWEEVILNPMDSKVIFVPYQTSYIQSDLPIIEVDNTSSLFGPGPHYRGREYSIYLLPGEEKQTFLAGGEESCLRLSHPFTRVRELASKITQGTHDPWEKGKRIEAYLKNNFGYTLKLTQSQGLDPVEDFLFNRKKGHCEFFASAMVIMLRSLNIPARVVNGFLVEEWNDFGGYYLVREKDAHSWVEAYIAGKGWIVFDPTPPQAGFWLRDTLFPLVYQLYDYLELKWDSYVVAYNIWDQRRMVQSLLDTQNRLLVWTETQLRALVDHISRVEFSTSIFLLTSLILFVFGLLYRACRLPFSLKRHPGVTKFYLRLLSILARKGISKERHLTPWEFAQQVIDEKGDKFACVGLITQRYYQSRYGGYRLSQDDLKQIDDLLKGLVTL